MDAQSKRQFIRELTASVRNELLKRVFDMPEAWDGHELRKLIAEKFAAADYSNVMRGRRLREYRNEVIVRNL